MASNGPTPACRTVSEPGERPRPALPELRFARFDPAPRRAPGLGRLGATEAVLQPGHREVMQVMRREEGAFGLSDATGAADARR